MNKEEILSKAQHEPDEMEYAVTEKALCCQDGSIISQ